MNQTNEWSVRIYYEDTDAGGIVYHTNYLKYMERARTEFFEQSYGESLFSLMERCQVQFVIKKLSITYHAPAKLGQYLTVQSTLMNAKHASLIFNQSIYIKEQPTPLCEAEVVVVCVNAAGKPCALPKTLGEKS